MMSIISLLNILLIILIAISFHNRWKKIDKLISIQKNTSELLNKEFELVRLWNKGLTNSYKIFTLSLKTLDILKNTMPLLPDDKKESLIKDFDEFEKEMNNFLSEQKKIIGDTENLTQK